MGIYNIQRSGFKADFIAGHSFGELTALWAAGAYDDQTFLALANARGKAMGTPSTKGDAGSMLAVKADMNTVQQIINRMPQLKIANINSDKQIILGGSTQAIQNAATQLKAEGLNVIPLSVAAAFHTEFVEHAQKPFAAFVQTQNFKAPHTKVYSNTTAAHFSNNVNEIKTTLQNQMLQPVRFKEQIENIYNDGGRIFIEFGPKAVLANLAKDILKGKEAHSIALNPNAKKDSDLQFRQAVLQLRVLGLNISHVDNFKATTITEKAKTKLNVVLGGHNYVSAGTQKAYTDVLNNDFSIQQASTKVVEKIVEKVVEKPVELKIVEVEKSSKLKRSSKKLSMKKSFIKICLITTPI